METTTSWLLLSCFAFLYGATAELLLCWNHCCELESEPVCGSNGILYQNQCQFENDACQIEDLLRRPDHSHCQDQGVRDQLCGEECVPHTKKKCGNKGSDYTQECGVVDSYCGGDGVDYSDECALIQAYCAKEMIPEIRHVGTCDVLDEREAIGRCWYTCPKTADTVCGDDGKVYNNVCELRNADCLSDKDISFVNYGSCENPIQHLLDSPPQRNRGGDLICEKNCAMANGGPVCDGENVTHRSPCAFDVAQCESLVPPYIKRLMRYGRCNIDPDCLAECDDDFAPVCGSNGSTYWNDCVLQNDNCATRYGIDKVSDGYCDGVSFTPILCGNISDPVCGSNGIEFPNRCELRNSNYFLNNRTSVAPCVTMLPTIDPSIDPTMTPEEPERNCDRRCGFDVELVCSNGVEFDNSCLMEKHFCRLNQPTPTFTLGTCPTEQLDCDEDCGTDVEPVCSNGVEYPNMCLFRKNFCRTFAPTSTLGPCEILSEGECHVVAVEEYDVPPHPGRTGAEVTIEDADPPPQVGGACDITPTPDEDCDESCEADGELIVCSNGVEYPNECMMRNHFCTLGEEPQWTIGPCPTQPDDDVDPVCVDGGDPVCGPDLETYGRRCLMVESFQTMRYLPPSFWTDGPCPERPPVICDPVCVDSGNPVCGPDQETYAGLCDMRARFCRLNYLPPSFWMDSRCE